MSLVLVLCEVQGWRPPILKARRKFLDLLISLKATEPAATICSRLYIKMAKSCKKER